MRYLLSVTILLACAQANASQPRGNAVCGNNHHAIGQGHQQAYSGPNYGHNYGYNNKAQYGAGYDIEQTALLRRELDPLRSQITTLQQTIDALRGEQKAGFSSLSAKFSFRGTLQVTGEGQTDVEPQPVPTPQPQPDNAEAAPPLTPAMKTLFTAKCAACHTGKATGFDVDKPLTASDAAEILARVDSDDPEFRMPKKGSVEEDRNAVRAWVFGPTILKLQTELKSRKGN